MRFPLYHRPNALIFLDDDASYLEMLAMVMPKNWYVRLYTHADDCIQRMEQEHVLWEADVWSHHTMVNNWRAGMPLIPQILQYWQTHAERYDLTKICVVDYAMPAMTGLDVLKTMPVWPSNRILLTGKADELIAVSAFNEGLIDKFIPKQHPNVGHYLTGILIEQHAKPMDFYDGIWRGTFKQEQYAALQDDSVQLALIELLLNKGWIEYVVVAEPFGVLGLDSFGKPHWLQLELVAELSAAAELADSIGQDSSVVEKIRRGTHMTNSELLLTLHSDEAVSIAPTVHIGKPGTLLGAFFDIPGNPKQGSSYNEFMSSRPPRTVVDLS
jgi:CheY-like chemotaxis protein